MGFTEIVQGARQGISDSMGRTAQKRENSLDRLQTALGRLSGYKQQTSEREAGQEYEAGQAVLERDFESLENERNRIFQLKVQGNEQDFERDLLKFEQDYGREMLSAQQRAAIDEIAARGKQDRLNIDAGATAERGTMAYADTIAAGAEERQDERFKGQFTADDGTTFAYSGEPEFIRAQTEFDAYNQMLRDAFAAEQDPQRRQEAYEFYQQAKADAMDDLWIREQDENGNFIFRRGPATVDDAIDNFKRSIAFDNRFTLDQKDKMAEAFSVWLKTASETPPDLDQTEAGDTTTVTPFMYSGNYGSEAANVMGTSDSPVNRFVAPILGAGQGLFGWIPGFNGALEDAARNVRQGNSPVSMDEEEIYKLLEALVPEELGQQGTMLRGQYTRDIERDRGTTDNLDIIKRWLESLGKL